MKTKIIFILLCFLSLNVMGQGIIRRNKPQTTQTQPTKTKTKTKTASKPKPVPEPEAAGYDVAFSCNVSSATLYIDGEAYNNASCTRFLKTGSHTIKVTAEGYKDYQKSISVNRQNTSCKITLEKKPEPAKPKQQGTTENYQQFPNSMSNEIYDNVEQMPDFPGGTSALMQYLGKHIKYPNIAEVNGIQGRVIVTFVVEKNGSITNVQVIKSVDPSLDKEAVRVVNSMPHWIPGKHNGSAVRVKYTLPVTFRLK